METKPRFNYTGYGFEGKMYDPNLGITDIAERVRFFTKKQYPDCKFSVTIERYSGGQSMDIALMSAPFEVFNKEYTKDKNGNVYNERDWEYSQLNKYSLGKEADGYCNGSYLTPKAVEVLKFAYDVATAYNFDDSDGMIDYFHTNFYLHLAIGRWNKPFVKSN